MSELRYGVYCEDISQLTFIDEFLKLHNDSFTFVLNNEFTYRFRANNSSQVFRNYVSVSVQAFRDFELDILFIGLDYDDRDRAQFKEEYSSLYEELANKFRDQTVIFFPPVFVNGTPKNF